MSTKCHLFALIFLLPLGLCGQSRAFEVFVTPNFADTNLDLVFADGRFQRQYALDYLMGGEGTYGGGVGIGYRQFLTRRFHLQLSLHTTALRYQYEGGITRWDETALAQTNLSDDQLAEQIQGVISHLWAGLDVGLQFHFIDLPATSIYLKPDFEMLGFYNYNIRQNVTYRSGFREREIGDFDPYSDIRTFLPLVGLGIGTYIHLTNRLSLNLECNYQYGLATIQSNQNTLPPQIINARIGLAFLNKR